MSVFIIPPLVIILFIIVIMVGYLSAARKKAEHDKPTSFDVGAVKATIIFEDGSSIEKFFEGKVIKDCHAFAHGVMFFKRMETAHSIFIKWLQQNQERGFIYKTETNLVRVSEIKEISLIQEQFIIIK